MNKDSAHAPDRPAARPDRSPDEDSHRHDEKIGYPSSVRARFALFALTAAYVVSFIDRQAISLLVEPIRRDMGLSDMQIGLLQGFAFATVYAVAGLPLGRAADQFERRRIIVLGVAFWSVMTSLCGVVRSFFGLLVCRAGVGVGEAALSPSAYSMLSDYFPPRRLPAAMSIYNLGPSLGSGLAYLLGGIILTFAGQARSIDLRMPFLHEVRPWQVTFVLLGALGFAVIALLLFVEEPERRLRRSEAPMPIRFGETLAFLRMNASSLGAFFAGLSLLGVLSYATMTWYPTMIVRSFGEPVSRTGLVFGPLYIVASIAGNLGGAWCALRVADRGHRDPYVLWTLVVALAVTCLGVLVPLVPSLRGTYAMSAFLIVAQTSWMGSAVAAMHLAVPNRMRAQLTAILLLGTNLVGLSLGPSMVAAITQYVFRDPADLRYSLVIVTAVAGTLAVITLRYSWRSLPRLTGPTDGGTAT
jgi:MFS family permease